MNFFFLLLIFNLSLSCSSSCLGAADPTSDKKRLITIESELQKECKKAVITNNKALVKNLLEQHPDLIFYQSRSGNTFLHYAYAHGHKSLIKLLIEKGADPKVQNIDGRKPISYYKKKRYFDTRPVLPEIYDIFLNAKKKNIK